MTMPGGCGCFVDIFEGEERRREGKKERKRRKKRDCV
jgi:hypothetical protein